MKLLTKKRVMDLLGLSEDFEKTWFRKDKFPQVAAYLGKSKANIDDLFKTENEE